MAPKKKARKKRKENVEEGGVKRKATHQVTTVKIARVAVSVAPANHEGRTKQDVLDGVLALAQPYRVAVLGWRKKKRK